MKKHLTKGLFLISVIFLFSCKTIDIEGTWISQSCKKGSITVDCYVLIQGGVIQNGGGVRQTEVFLVNIRRLMGKQFW